MGRKVPKATGRKRGEAVVRNFWTTTFELIIKRIDIPDVILKQLASLRLALGQAVRLHLRGGGHSPLVIPSLSYPREVVFILSLGCIPRRTCKKKDSKNTSSHLVGGRTGKELI